MSDLLSLEDLAREQFFLGEDYAFYGLTLPERLANCDEAIKGYEYSKKQKKFGAKQSDKYIRKWLQLRTGAMVRSRTVDGAVTPEFIRHIEVNQCPVSRISLAYGTCEDTDWSVDRMCNDAGYAIGNLVILSSRVNKAKGNKSFEEVEARATGQVVDDALTSQEWKRLLVLMAGPCDAVEGTVRYMPYIVQIPPTLACSWFIMIQATMAQVATTPNKQAELDWKKAFCPVLSPKAQRRALEVIGKARQKAIRKNAGFVADLFAMPSVVKKFGEFLEALTDDEVHGIVEVCRAHSEIEYSNRILSSWKIGTKGFLSSKPEKLADTETSAS